MCKVRDVDKTLIEAQVFVVILVELIVKLGTDLEDKVSIVGDHVYAFLRQIVNCLLHLQVFHTLNVHELVGVSTEQLANAFR